jgi:hypothetical protein
MVICGVGKRYRGKLQTEIEEMHPANPVIRSHHRNGFVKQDVRDHLMLRTEAAGAVATEPPSRVMTVSVSGPDRDGLARLLSVIGRCDCVSGREPSPPASDRSRPGTGRDR